MRNFLARRHLHQPWFPILILLLLAGSCADRDESDLPEYLQDMPTELAYHLSRSDDSTFVRYGREAGYQIFYRAQNQLGFRSLSYLKKGEPELSADVDRYRRRIATVLATEFHSPEWMARLDFLYSLTTEERLDLDREWRVRTAAARSAALTTTERSGQQDQSEIKFQRYGDKWGIAMCRQTRGELWLQSGDARRAKAEFWAAYRVFSDLGWRVMTCQVLGLLGNMYSGEGKVDSMVFCYEEAKRIANRSRMPVHAARINSFYSSYYRTLGRWSVASDLLDKAQTICREYKGGKFETRFVSDAINYYAQLGCWNVVERLIKRARILEHQHEDKEDLDLFKLVQLELDLGEARMLMAKGRVEEGVNIFERALPAARQHIYRSHYLRFLYYYAQSLVDNDLVDRALPVIAEAEEDSVGIYPDWSGRFLILQAKAALSAKDLATATRLLDQFEQIADRYESQLRGEWIEHDAMLVDVNLTAGDSAGATVALGTGMERLYRYLRDTDAGAAGYVWLHNCEPLRRASHNVLSGDPLLGYGAEMCWRETVRELGAGDRKDVPTGHRPIDDSHTLVGHTILDDFRSHGRVCVDNIRSRGASHLLYAIDGELIVRWTVDRETVRVDTVATNASQLRALAAETWFMMSAPNRAGGDDRLSSLVPKLKSLGRVLLPPELSENSPRWPRLVLISTDGFLGRVPFEAFDPTPGREYRPLLTVHDVAYLRYQNGTPSAGARGSGLVLASTVPSGNSGLPLQQMLPEAEAEAEVVASEYSDARLLKGESATKAALQSNWGDASFIYVAAHTSRDPEVPFLAMISLVAAHGDSPPDAGLLEIADIRTADLSVCDVVVLSGCSSGAPYVDTRTVGPSLGDAFLDAGAGSVVQTFWDVRDDEARQMMTSFVRVPGSLDSNGIRALNQVKRDAMFGSNGIRHPSAWAAYSIKMSRF